MHLLHKTQYNYIVKDEVGWVRTNDGFPVDLQSTALTTQPLPH